jgi:hypothetical protein
MQRQYTEPPAARCREHFAMPGEQWESLLTQTARSLEVLPAVAELTGLPHAPVDHHRKARSCGISDWCS